MIRFTLLVVLAPLGAAACGAPYTDDASDAGTAQPSTTSDYDAAAGPPSLPLPPMTSAPPAAGTCTQGATETTPMKYRGGPVLGHMDVYYIFYGDFSGSTTPAILADFTSNLGGSPYFDILSTYWTGNHLPIDSRLQYRGSVFVAPGDPAWRGTTLSSDVAPAEAATSDDLYKILAQEIDAGAVPLENAIYFFITAKDVSVTNFCVKYMGWHAHGTIGNTTFGYSMAGSALQCGGVQDCFETSPNDNPEADDLANVVAHELAESYTNFLFDESPAWMDTNAVPEEMADKCAWNYGEVTQLANGSFANVDLGDRAYLLQQLFVNDGSGYCGMSWVAPVKAGATYTFGADAHAGSCMDAEGGGTTDGTQIQEYTCNGSGAQTFVAKDAGNGTFNLVNPQSSKCIDVSENGTANGTKIQLHTCNGTSAQSFVTAGAGNGAVYLVNTNSDKCLDVTKDNPANGTVVQLYTCNQTNAQKWIPSAE
jgi:Ricin-type beta-trefoil lectin domain/Phosphate-induced protein 1 conserved region